MAGIWSPVICQPGHNSAKSHRHFRFCHHYCHRNCCVNWTIITIISSLPGNLKSASSPASQVIAVRRVINDSSSSPTWAISQVVPEFSESSSTPTSLVSRVKETIGNHYYRQQILSYHNYKNFHHHNHCFPIFCIIIL